MQIYSGRSTSVVVMCSHVQKLQQQFFCPGFRLSGHIKAQSLPINYAVHHIYCSPFYLRVWIEPCQLETKCSLTYLASRKNVDVQLVYWQISFICCSLTSKLWVFVKEEVVSDWTAQLFEKKEELFPKQGLMLFQSVDVELVLLSVFDG